MNFFTDIKFNRELTENEYCTITYSGKLFKNNSDLVSIVYGYGENWTHTREQKMTKTEEGFVVDVKLLDNFDTFNFCFKNSYNEWDNNNTQNYSSPIIKQSANQSFIINENIINDILDNMLSINLYEEEQKNSTSASNNSNKETIESFDIDLEENEPVNIEASLVNSIEEKELNNDIENLFNDIYEKNQKQELLNNILVSNTDVPNQETKENNFNMNSLINEILTPIVSSSVFDEEESFEDLLHSSEKNYNQTNTVSSNSKENVKPLEANVEVNNNANDVNNDVNKDNENNKIEINDIEKLDFKESEEILQNDFELNKKINELITDLYKSVEISKASLSSQEAAPKDESSNIESSENTDDDYYDEESLMDIFNITNSSDSKNEETSLVEVKDNFIVSARSLSKFYLFKKKVKLAFCKIFYAIPRFLNKNFNTNKEQD